LHRTDIVNVYKQSYFSNYTYKCNESKTNILWYIFRSKFLVTGLFVCIVYYTDINDY